MKWIIFLILLWAGVLYTILTWLSLPTVYTTVDNKVVGIVQDGRCVLYPKKLPSEYVPYIVSRNWRPCHENAIVQ